MHAPNPGRWRYLLVLLAGNIAFASGPARVSPSSPPATVIGSAEADQPTFEVATVKPSPADERVANAVFVYPGGRMQGRGCTLFYLLTEAYHLPPFQIEGGPAWLRSDRFNFEAKSAADSEASHTVPAHAKGPLTELQRRMLRSLLEDRFHLQAQFSEREGKVYLLQADKAKLKLQPPADPHAYAWAGPPDSGEGLQGINITMPYLAERLSSSLEIPVLDRTGLPGSYDFLHDMGEGENTRTTQDHEAVVLASLHALGLSLKAAKGPVPVLVVQHAEQPTPD